MHRRPVSSDDVDHDDDEVVRQLAGSPQLQDNAVAALTNRSVSSQRSPLLNHGPSMGHGAARSLSMQMSPHLPHSVSKASSTGETGKQFRHVNDTQSFMVKENGPVKDVSNTSDQRYKGTWIAEVTIAHPNGDLIRKYNTQQQRLEQVRDE